MEITKRICDRCGRKLSKRGKSIYITITDYPILYEARFLSRYGKSYELCEKCAKKIVEEIKRGEEVNSKFGNKKLPPKKK